MAGKVCLKCKKELSFAKYIAVNSEFFSGSTTICRNCLSSMIEQQPEEKRWNYIDRLCQWINVPFLPGEWEKLYLANGTDTLGVYVSVFRSQEYSRLNWDDYNKVYLQLQEENRVEDAIPELNEKKQRELRKKWSGYADEEIEYLENLHQGLLNSQNIVGTLNEDQALKLCKISLILENKMRAGEDFTKELRGYDALATLANLTPKNVKNANEFDSCGEIFSYLEKTGWTAEYYDGAVRDEVDYTEKNMKNWLRYLYVNETGVAEEIEERIKNLKLAAELEEGESFNEEEFREYLNNAAETEDFKPDL